VEFLPDGWHVVPSESEGPRLVRQPPSALANTVALRTERQKDDDDNHPDHKSPPDVSPVHSGPQNWVVSQFEF
jgi:hypothetical protein